MFLRSLAVIALVAPLALAQEKADKPEKGEGAAVYKKAVPSVVWIHSTRSAGLATGSGSLVDADRRLVLTNYHVVLDNPAAKVFFPHIRDGQPVAEKDYYRDRAKRLAIDARVIAVDKKADLAVLRLDAIPEGTPAIALATGSPDPGETVHSIGSAGKSDALFGYVKGSVRQVYKKEWRAEMSPRKVATFEAKVVETDSATNPGDSGGPLLNSQGELVGVTQGGALNAQLVSTFIDVSEVKQLLATRAVKEVKAEKPVAKKERATPAASDEAKLFSADAVEAANEAVAELFKADLDVMIETHEAATADEKQLAELRKDRAAREEYMKKFTRSRMVLKEADIGLVIVKDPKTLYVELTGPAEKLFPADMTKKLVTTLTDGLKANKPDDALKNALQLIRDSRTPSKEKK
jgi:S1-C subfamily serine protease